MYDNNELDPFNRFDTTSSCDRWTDRQTERQDKTIANSALAYRHAGKYVQNGRNRRNVNGHQTSKTAFMSSSPDAIFPVDFAPNLTSRFCSLAPLQGGGGGSRPQMRRAVNFTLVGGSLLKREITSECLFVHLHGSVLAHTHFKLSFFSV